MFDLTTPQTRTYHARAAADPIKREVEGIGVPLETEIEVMPGFREVFAQDCVFEGLERAKLKWDHRTLIGTIISAERASGVLNVVGRVSETTAGNDALTLANDKALDSFSIGFSFGDYEQTDHDDGSFTIRHTRVVTREFTLTDNPAYTDAIVTDVRTAHREETAMTAPTDTLTRADLTAALAEHTEQRTAAEAEQAEQIRSLTAALAQVRDSAPVTTDTRSAGQVLQAIASGDETAIREYNQLIAERAYTGSTTAASPIKDAWVGDLTRIFDASSGVLSEIFSEGALPDSGMNVEYAQLKSNSVKVDEQAAEGDDLATGKIELETKTAPVKTYGGYVSLTLQQIQRSTLPVLDRTLEALAVAAGARKKAVMRAAYLALVASRTGLAADAGVLKLGAAQNASTVSQWTSLIVDAAVRFESMALPLEGMIVGAGTFKFLSNLEVAGNRVFKVAADRNTVGTLDLPGLSGDLGGIQVRCDTGRAADAAEFYHSSAIRQYDTGVTQLQDDNIINLSKSFSVYKFGAVAPEVPTALVPVKFAA